MSGKEFLRYSLLGCFQVTAFAPFSQNWKVEVCSLSGHAQPGQSKPAGLLVGTEAAAPPRRHLFAYAPL